VKQNVLLKKIFKACAVFLIPGMMAVVAVSYVTMRKLTYSDKYDERRQQNAKKAVRIREQLISNHHAKQVRFTTEDKISLSGLYFARNNPKGTMIVCHGYRSNKEMFSGLVDIFPDYNFLLFDFRAHGQSGGDVTSIGVLEYRDVIAASKFVHQRVRNAYSGQNHPVIILGVSMGGAAAIKATAHDSKLCDALIVDSAYADLREVVDSGFSRHSGLPRFPFLSIAELLLKGITGISMDQMRTVDFVKNLTKPVLFIHACNDEYTLSHDSIRLYNETKSKHAKLWIGPQAAHAELHLEYPELYQRKVTGFLRKIGCG
jgi:fermentation-respiration switch protein FrsA (DUF1100 family)